MKKTYRPYQIEDSDLLEKKKWFCVFHEMRVGKTPIAIRASRKIKKDILVICPSGAKYNWQKEFMAFEGRKAFVSEAGKPFSNAYPINITSFEYLDQYPEYFRKSYELIIIDEGHRLKSPQAIRTLNILGKKEGSIDEKGKLRNPGLIHKTKRLWNLTGTPAPNHAGELWPILYVLGMTKLSYEGFINRYCKTYMTGGRYSRLQITGSDTKHTPELKAILKKISIRRKKSSLNFPPKEFSTFFVKGDSKLILDSDPVFKERLQAELKLIEERINFKSMKPDDILNQLALLSQSVPALRRYHGLKKVVPVADIIAEELRYGLLDKVIIFGCHFDVLTQLRLRLESYGFKGVMATGRNTPRQKYEAQEEFQNNKEVRFFVGNIKAAGENLTLSAADNVDFIEQDWVPGNNYQASDRPQAHGKKNTIFVRNFVIDGSVDDKITHALVRKTQEISTFLD